MADDTEPPEPDPPADEEDEEADLEFRFRVNDLWGWAPDVESRLLNVEGRLQTLEVKMSNVLRQLGSVWAHRFFPSDALVVLPSFED